MVEQGFVGVVILYEGINSSADGKSIVLDKCIDISPCRHGAEKVIVDVEYLGTECIEVPSSIFNRIRNNELGEAARMVEFLP